MDLVISFTKDGKTIGEKISKALRVDHIINSEYKGDIRDYIGENWKSLDKLIFVSSTGIAVRYIKDYIISKDIDPAIVVVDDQGKNVVSLLSGHLGGANQLTVEIASLLKAYPVITTATDNKNIQAVDLFAKENSYKIERLEDIKPISMAMVENKKIGFLSNYKPVIDYKNLVILEDLDSLKGLEGLIIVSNKLIKRPNIPTIILRPQNLVLGIGCKKGKSKTEILGAIDKELASLNKSKNSIKFLATATAKKEEKGLIEAAKDLQVDLKIYSNGEISTVDEKFSKSDFVKKTIGVYNVSESAAYLASKNLLSQKQIYDGITISVGEINE